MVQSFIVYGLFGILMFILGQVASLREKENLAKNKVSQFFTPEVVLMLLVFSFISGVRWNVGVDHLTYLDNYLSVQNGGFSRFEKEIGFEFITNLFAKSGIHFSVYFGFLAFIQLFFILRTFKDQRYLYPFLVIIIIFGTEYLSWMNGIRQMLAATMFVFSIQFIQKRQLFKYIVTIFIASLFHKTALILLIFYIIPQKDYFKNRTFTFLLVIISLILGSMKFWIENLTQLSYLLSFMGYEWYSDNIKILTENEEIRNIGPRRLSMMLAPIIIIWFSPKLKNAFKNTYFLAYYNFTIIGFLLYNIFANLNHGFIRPITYLTIFIVPASAFLLVYLSRNIEKKRLIFIISLLIILSYLPLSIVADSGKGKSDYSNYKFYWDNR